MRRFEACGSFVRSACSRGVYGGAFLLVLTFSLGKVAVAHPEPGGSTEPQALSRCPFARLQRGVKSTFAEKFADLRERLARLPRQLRGQSPFVGDIQPTRVPIFKRGRPALPFPHPWNYHKPLDILATYFWGADKEVGSGRDNRYLEVPGAAPIFITRDAEVIRAITQQTGNRPGEFDRDQMPSMGISASTGPFSMLFSNQEEWYQQRKQAAAPFGLTALFQPEVFHGFENTFRDTMTQRVGVLREHLKATGEGKIQMAVEPEIKTVMLQMLVNNFFGANVPYADIRGKYVPALERIIDQIVKSTVVRLPFLPRRRPGTKADNAAYDELTDIVIAARKEGTGLWKKFKSDASDKTIRDNVQVILAGALEATSSWGGWTLSHLAQHPEMQEKLYAELKDIDQYTPENLEKAPYLHHVLDETLRLTPSLYFLPRQAPTDIDVETADHRKIRIPKGTHILLDVWDTNHREDRWGVAETGYPATDFAPERWEEMAKRGINPKNKEHFGFGLGKRVCPGKHLGKLEVSLLVGAFVKTFKFKAVNPATEPRAGVSTKPLDGTMVELELRNP